MMDTILHVIREFASALGLTFSEMAPYLLFGFFVAGVLSLAISPQIVQRHLGSHGFASILKASLFGVPLPLCSCGVIPVATSLRRHGASRGATTAFLLSTPQTGVDSVFVTLSLLGPVFAIFRPLAALLTGIFGGLLASLFDPDGASPEPPPTCDAACCNPQPGRGGFLRMLHYGFVTLPRDIAKALLIGLVIAALIAAFVPSDFFAGRLGNGLTGMFVMMLCGIPMYVCATASVPVAAALITTGVSPGAALVFLMTGPATNAISITTIYRIMGARTAAAYLGSVAFCALGFGLLLDAVFKYPGIPQASGMVEMLPPLVGYLSAAVLLVVLFAALVPRRSKEIEAMKHAGPESLTLHVTGMTCSHCRDAVHRALAAVGGVAAVAVDLASGKAVVSGEGLDLDCLAAAVVSVGYEVANNPEIEDTDNS